MPVSLYDNPDLCKVSSAALEDYVITQMANFGRMMVLLSCIKDKKAVTFRLNISSERLCVASKPEIKWVLDAH